MAAGQTKDDVIVKLKEDQLVFKTGDHGRDMYLVHEGELNVFVRKGTQVQQIGVVKKGEYVGELTFFDGRPRSADVITAMPTTLIRLPFHEIRHQIPKWLTALASFMTSKIRLYDDVIGERGLKRRNVQHRRPLSIQEQTEVLRLINAQQGIETPPKPDAE